MQAYVMALALTTFPSVKVTKIHDGDTFNVNIPGESAVFGSNLPVRISGIDTPELGCAELGTRAKAELVDVLTPTVELTDCDRDKYFRINCRVLTTTGVDVGKHLLTKRLAKSYQGRTKPKWECE